MGFQCGAFPWFPDQNTIVFIHEMRSLCRVPHFSRKLGRAQWRIPGYKRRCRGIRASRIQNTTPPQFPNVTTTYWQLTVPTGCLTIRNMITDARLTSVKWEDPDSRLFKSSGVMTPCVYPTLRRTVLPLSSRIKQSKKNSCHFIILYNEQQVHTIISQIITFLHVSTLLCYPQTACNQYLAKLHKYFKCSYW